MNSIHTPKATIKAGSGLSMVVPARNAPVATMQVKRNRIRFFIVLKFMISDFV